MCLGSKLKDHIVLQVVYKKRNWIKAKLKLKLLGDEVGDPTLEEQSDIDGRGVGQGGGAIAPTT